MQELETDVFVSAIARAEGQLFIEAMGGKDVLNSTSTPSHGMSGYAGGSMRQAVSRS
jgi:hypothetical protein